MPATHSKPLNLRVSWRVLFLRTLIVSAGVCVATAAGANEAQPPPQNPPPRAASRKSSSPPPGARRASARCRSASPRFSQDMLDQKGIRDFTELVRFTPGVSIDTSGTNRSRSAASPRRAAPARPASTSTTRRFRCASSDSTPTTRCRRPSISIASRCCAGPQGTLFGVRLRGRHGALHHDAAERDPGIDLRAQRGLRTRDTAQPSCEAGIAHGGPIIDDVLGYRASIWYRYDGGWINRVDNAGDITEKNANHAGHDGGAPRAALAAERQREDHAERHVPEQAAA